MQSDPMSNIYNNTRLNTFDQCKRKYYWLYEYGLKPSYLDPKLAFGIIAHAGLASLYHRGPGPWVAQALQEEFKNLFPPGSLDPAEQARWDEDMDLAQRLVDTYTLETYPQDDFQATQVEVPFKVSLGEICYKCGTEYLEGEQQCSYCNSPIYYIMGRIDLVCNRDGGVKILDHKTASGGDTEKWAHVFQPVGYAYGYSKATGVSVKGYGINILRKLKTFVKERQHWKQCPDCRNGSKKRLNCQTCEGAGKVRKDEDPSSKPFLRVWHSIGPRDFDRFVRNRIRVIQDIEQERRRFAAEPDAAWRMNDSECFRFGKCPFIELCWQGESSEWYDPPSEIVNNFEPREDDYVDLEREEMR